MNTAQKSKYWGLIVYPDSAPSDWLSLVEELYVPFAVSPLHDRDVDSDGNFKKPHWHVVFQFSNSTTSGLVKRAQVICHSPQFIALSSGSGSFLYLTHENQKDKFHYSSDDVQLFNGFDVSALDEKDNRCVSMKRLFKYIRDNHISEYSILLDRLIEDSLDELFMLAVRNAYALRTYLISQSYVDERIVACAKTLLEVEETRVPSLYSPGEYKQFSFSE